MSGLLSQPVIRPEDIEKRVSLIIDEFALPFIRPVRISTSKRDAVRSMLITTTAVGVLGEERVEIGTE
jgi:hypothetical protein